MTQTSQPSLAEFLLDDTVLLDRTMTPYVRKDTVYLKQATVVRRGEIIVGSGDLGFDHSCYIEETGHFNAVEFVISYNQLIYFTLAASVRDQLIPELSGWTMDDYWQRQLPSVLISKMTTRFRQPINSRSYRGVLRIIDIEFRNRSRPLLAMQTTIEFTDDGGGSALGEVEIVLVDLPAQS
ncbi:MAG: FcoT family thioesterase [Actinomycetota bacterium]|uniref:(2E)-enoyl-[ACP] glycyltransferase n=1 Tax=Mycobacterium lentiflavum TaxID=141349 RepID=A0ABY3UMJ5_MYCLN|nr:FcoT family thioesterase [Mycobacterium lentiflavum]MEE3062912.1 FcoT family thioesterase [Actinomycetota bacterium]ULP40825.1 FcoT family thioesterase [Mycobacterium lentiflavum]